MKVLSSLLFVAIWILASGCASLSDRGAITNKDVSINNIGSDEASINQVNIKSSTAGTIIRGQLRRKYTATGPIPGHLDIKITNPNGKVQYAGQVGYMRKNRKSIYSKFALSLDQAIAKGSTVQIKHHATANIVEQNGNHH